MTPEERVSLLIVEDDANIRYLLEVAAARAEGIQLVAALEDGDVALDWLATRAPQELPDIVLTDLSMPRLSGLELVRAMKTDAHLSHIPVAMLTSSNMPNDRDDAHAAGVCDFIVKPHGLEALTKIMVRLRALADELGVKRHHAA